MILKTALPSGLAEFISQAAKTPTQERRLVRFARYVLGKYIWNGIPLEDPIEISREHFRNQLDSQYHGELRVFQAAGVIQTDHHYTLPERDPITRERRRLGQCKRYVFNPQYILSDPSLVLYNERTRKSFEADPIVRKTVELLSRITLSIDARELVRYVQRFISLDHVRARCKIGQEIPDGFYYGQGFKIPRPLDHWQEIAKRNSLDLILYRDKLFLAPAEPFISRRVYQTRQTYLDALARLKEIRKRPNIYCQRNDTNRRLDSNLTNVKSELLSLVRLDGDRLVSIDLKNSQLTILAHVIEAGFDYCAYLDQKHFTNNFYASGRSDTRLRQLLEYRKRGDINRVIEQISLINVTKFLPKTTENKDITTSIPSDLVNFQKSTKSGLFYDQFAGLLSADAGREITRAEVKPTMFLTIFSSHRYNPPAKKLLARHYPSLVTWTNTFKRLSIEHYRAEGLPDRDARDRGNAELAVMLQEIESGIFIDGILARLLREGYRVFTKHDSILCKESDLGSVLAIVRAELDQVLGEGEYQLAVSPT